MDAVLINLFIDAAINVLETLGGGEIKVQKPYLKKRPYAKGDISSVIEMSGETNGTFSISFSEKSILSIVSIMFGEEMKELNDDIKDAVGEIANMISGQVTQKWITVGKSLKADLSTVVMGQNHKISDKPNHKIVVIPLDTNKGEIINKGEITIEVCFEQ